MNLLSPGNPAEYLASRYSGSLDTRALWEWAGGRPDEAVFDEDPVARWKTLWEKAGTGKTASDIALLREALFDSPGDQEGLAIIDGLAEERWARWRPSADLLLTLVDSLFPEPGPHSLWLSLQTFPDLENLASKPADCAFGLLAARMQGRYDPDRRRVLEEMLDRNAALKPPGLDEFTHFVSGMLSRAARETFDELGSAVMAVQEGVASMRSAVHARDAAPLVTAASESFESLRTMQGARPDSPIQEAVNASLRLLACLRSIKDDEPPPSRAEICTGFVHAMWATQPAAESEAAEADSGDESAEVAGGA